MRSRSSKRPRNLSRGSSFSSTVVPCANSTASLLKSGRFEGAGIDTPAPANTTRLANLRDSTSSFGKSTQPKGIACSVDDYVNPAHETNQSPELIRVDRRQLGNSSLGRLVGTLDLCHRGPPTALWD